MSCNVLLILEPITPTVVFSSSTYRHSRMGFGIYRHSRVSLAIYRRSSGINAANQIIEKVPLSHFTGSQATQTWLETT